MTFLRRCRNSNSNNQIMRRDFMRKEKPKGSEIAEKRKKVKKATILNIRDCFQKTP